MNLIPNTNTITTTNTLNTTNTISTNNTISTKLPETSAISATNTISLQTISIQPLDYLGYWSPVILASIGIMNLPNTEIFIALLIINIIINKVLKKWIRQPRPEGSETLYSWENYQDEEQFGMPSGHAELSSFSVSYLYWMQGSIAWLIVGIFLTIMTCIQRWRFKLHSIPQLAVGIAVGSAMGYLSYIGTPWYIQRICNYM